jgi:hypothetical protein
MTLKEIQEIAEVRTDRRARMARRNELTAADHQFYTEEIERMLDSEPTETD